jgi:hypothetical protein
VTNDCAERGVKIINDFKDVNQCYFNDILVGQKKFGAKIPTVKHTNT